MQSQTFYSILLFHKTNFILHRVFYKYYTKKIVLLFYSWMVFSNYDIVWKIKTQIRVEPTR